MKNCRAIVIGSSAGGVKALKVVLSSLAKDFSLPIAIVQHLGSGSNGMLAGQLCEKSHVLVKEAEDKESLRPGIAYIAPPDYHLLIEKDATFSLSVDEKVNFSRPSIDVLFESAAVAYGLGLVGIVLTGSNSDGALGLKKIHANGGLTIVQDPLTAESPKMPQYCLDAFDPDHILSLEEIGPFINSISIGSGG